MHPGCPSWNRRGGAPRPGAGGARAGRRGRGSWSAATGTSPDAAARRPRTAGLAQPAVGPDRRDRGASGAAGLRPGDRRSDAFRRRRDPGAAVRARRDDDRARRFRLLAGGGAARLAAGGGGVPDPARPAAGTDPAGAPTRPPDPGAEPRRRDAGRCGGAAAPAWLGGRAAWWRSPHMDGPEEVRVEATAAGWTANAVPDFNTLAIELQAMAQARPLPVVPGLPDDAFRHDGKLTKRAVRAATLAMLAPGPGQVLWDVGGRLAARSRSNGCARLQAGGPWRSSRSQKRRAIDRRQRPGARNAAARRWSTGVPPRSLRPCRLRTRFFVGGCGIHGAGARWRPAGRPSAPAGVLVANVVTLQGEAEVLRLARGAWAATFPPHRGSAGPNRSARSKGWKHQMTVTQLAATKALAGHGRHDGRPGTLYGLGVGPGGRSGADHAQGPAPACGHARCWPGRRRRRGPSLARSIVEEHLAGRPDRDRHSACRCRWRASRPQEVYDRAADEMAGHLSAGRERSGCCARGSPFFYGSFMYLFGRMVDRFPVHVVPGVSSMMACSAVLDAPLAARKRRLDGSRRPRSRGEKNRLEAGGWRPPTLRGDPESWAVISPQRGAAVLDRWGGSPDGHAMWSGATMGEPSNGFCRSRRSIRRAVPLFL